MWSIFAGMYNPVQTVASASVDLRVIGTVEQAVTPFQSDP